MSSKHPQISVDHWPLSGGGYEAAMCTDLKLLALLTSGGIDAQRIAVEKNRVNLEMRPGSRSDEK